MRSLEPPVLTASVGSRGVRIHTGELLFPALVLAFCAFYFLDTRGLPDLSMLYAGPLLYVTAALAVVTIGSQAISVSEGEVPAGEASPDVEPGGEFFDRRGALGLVGLLAGYVLVLDVVGFLIATIAFLAAALYLFGERNPVVIAGYSIAFAVVVWMVFSEWLLVPLP